MLWSLAKALIFFALVAALTWGAAILSAAGGGIRIAMLGHEVTLGPVAALVALVALFVALWLVLRLAGLILAILRFIAGDETALTRHFTRNRERRGRRALSEAMLALAAGEPRMALARARRAERLLDDDPAMSRLVIAQAAEAAGDHPRAEAAWRAMLADPDSRLAGIRGLLRGKLAEGDTDCALRLAEQAFALRPDNAETRNLLQQLQIGASDWQGARRTLGAAVQAGSLPRDVWRRRDAVLALQEARVLLDEHASPEAQAAAIAANKASPDLIPAAAMAARAHIAAGRGKVAARLLRKAWGAQPHPDLAAAYAAIAPDESAAARVRRFRALTDIAPDHPESRMLMAELHIAAEDFPAARRSLGDLATSGQPVARALTIMAAIERGSGADDAAVRGWLARALVAPRGPQWVCDKCHAVHARWAPVCDNCQGFDTLAWTEPAEASGPTPTQTEMLPLIVGQPEPEPTPVPEPAPEPEPELEPAPETEPEDAPEPAAAAMAPPSVAVDDRDPAGDDSDRPSPADVARRGAF